MSSNRKEMAIGLLIVLTAFAVAAAIPLPLSAISLMGFSGYGCLVIGRSVGRETGDSAQ